MTTLSVIPNEEEMVDVFLRSWKITYNRRFIFSMEVKFYQKRVDYVQIPLYNKNRLGAAHAIEFKLFDWKNGLKQAKQNRVIFPFNTIAIWHDFVHRVNLGELKREGIGLIEVSYNESKIILKPQRSPYIDKFHYEYLRNQILKENRKDY